MKLATPHRSNLLNADYFRQQGPGSIEQLLASLTPKEATELLYLWEFWAREKQLFPTGIWSVWLILSGRGFGKTRTGAEWLRAQAEALPRGRFAIVGQTAADVRDVMIEGDSGLVAVSPPWFMPKYEPSKRRVTWPNGAVATTFSGDEPDQLRGPQFHKAWADEPAKWKYADAAWDNLEMGLRLGDDPQVVATTTPRPIPLIRKLIADEQTVITRGHTNENRSNLSERFVDRVIRKYEGTRLGRQELAGEILDDNPGALWKRSRIEELAVKDYPDLARIVVAVDPQVADPTQKDKEDATAETGIIVAGRTAGSDGHAYILADCSLKDSPGEWGKAVVNAFTEWKADRVVGEVNNGGALVEFLIATVAKDQGKRVAYKAVHASRGKQTRAEPVAALYEQGRVHHVGAHPELEDQMCTWEPGQKSPDRMDALVWAITELFPEIHADTEKRATPILPSQRFAGMGRK